MEKCVGRVLCAIICAMILGFSSANSEGDALHAFRRSVSDPSSVLQSWDTSLVNPCTWFRVSCNIDNYVIRVDLGNAALSGMMNFSLFSNLMQLQSLHLGGNNLSLGMINMIPKSLRVLNLSYTMPTSIDLQAYKATSSLQELYLASTYLSITRDSIPDSLRVLDLSYNKLSNFDIYHNNQYSSSLQYLYLAGNQLTEVVMIPNSLRILDLSYNKFSSSHMLYPNNDSLLQQLHIQHNLLSGLFPTYLLNFPNIQLFVTTTLNTICSFKSKAFTRFADNNHFNDSLDLNNHTCGLQVLSMVYNDITSYVPTSDRISIPAVFLGGNPCCNNNTQHTLADHHVCRFTDTIVQYVIVPTKKRIIVILSTTLPLLGILTMGACGFILWRIQTKMNILREIQQEFAKQQVQPTLYSYGDLKLATKDFHPSQKLGEGGFGVVFKGTSQDGTQLAVKKLSQCRHGVSDFLNEVVLITGIRHRNLVKLKGCCLETQRILVYEYMENNNLAEALWEPSTRGLLELDWSTRFNICIGVSRGLVYLHEETQPRIIHRDIKAPNILLDKDLKAKIADFGLARLFPDEQSHLFTTRVAGTMGYIAPEYATWGQLTEKVDVYSFGVLVLEVVSGRKNIDLNLDVDKIYLLEWAWSCYEEGRLFDILDQKLIGSASPLDVHRVISVALLCIQTTAAKRPSMSSVLAMLLGNIEMEINLRETNIWSRNIAHLIPEDQSTNLNTISEDIALLHDERMPCTNVLELSNLTPR